MNLLSKVENETKNVRISCGARAKAKASLYVGGVSPA
jgi:hypothetical protein